VAGVLLPSLSWLGIRRTVAVETFLSVSSARPAFRSSSACGSMRGGPTLTCTSRIWRPDSPKLKVHCWRKSPKSRLVILLAYFIMTWWRLRGLLSTLVRHRWEKPQYKMYLENERKELAASSSNMADVPNSNTRKTAAIPPTSERIVSREDNSEQSKCTGAVSRGMRTRAAAARAARLEKESGQQTGPTTRARVPSPRRSPENKRELNSMPLGGPAIGIPPPMISLR
jgi:hypothetical protein